MVDPTDYLADNFAFCPSRAKPIIPIPPKTLGDGYSEKNFKMLIQANFKLVPAEASAQVALWLHHKKLRTVEEIEMRPDKPLGFFRDDRGAFLNMYRPPNHPTVTDEYDWAVDLFQEFLVHLIPDAAERNWFTHWLAHKFQNPASRGVGVIMVAAYGVYGAGRGTLFKLIEALFGFDFVRTIPWPILAGEGGQGQFNSWAAEAVVVCVDEIGKKEGAGRHSANREIFERLKTRVDPTLTQMDINAKNFSPVKRPVFFSTICATNNKDAVAIPAGDRRFTVIENGDKLSESMAVRMEAMRKDPHAVAAVAAYLASIEVSGFNSFKPLETDLKSEMTDAFVSPLEEMITEVVAEFPGDLFTTQQVEMAIRRKQDVMSAERWTTKVISTALTNNYPTVRARNSRLERNGKKFTVFAKTRDGRSRWEFKPNDAIAAEGERNGKLDPDFLSEAQSLPLLPGMSPFPPQSSPHL